MTGLKPSAPVLMLWRTERTIMFGANQIAEIEADIKYARENGIALVRRSSGGGTIYTDPGTLLYTIILPADGAANRGAAAGIMAGESATATPKTDDRATDFATMTDPKSVVKDYLAAPVIRALKEMGVCASLEGRNDILVDGKKISGIAQYIKYGYICSHGSLLFNANLEELARVLTANDEKIKSKALRSIRSRVTNIEDHLPGGGATGIGISDFITVLRESWNGVFGISEYAFSKNDLAEIEKIRAAKYADDGWTFGHTPEYSFRNAKRFPGGAVEIFADIKNGSIKQIKIMGDFLALRPVSDIESKLTGVLFEHHALESALTEAEVAHTLGSITLDELLSVFA